MASEAVWRTRVAAWRESGQKADEFARGRGFRASTLRWWASRLARSSAVVVEGAAKLTPPVRFVRVARRTSAPQAPIVVHVGGGRIEVGAGADIELLRALVAALGTSP